MRTKIKGGRGFYPFRLMHHGEFFRHFIKERGRTNEWSGFFGNGEIILYSRKESEYLIIASESKDLLIKMGKLIDLHSRIEDVLDKAFAQAVLNNVSVYSRLTRELADAQAGVNWPLRYLYLFV